MCVAVRLVILASGILIVAKHVYWPLFDNVSGENTYSTNLVFNTVMVVELGNLIIMSGNAIRPDGTSAEQWMKYF